MSAVLLPMSHCQTSELTRRFLYTTDALHGYRVVPMQQQDSSLCLHDIKDCGVLIKT